MMETLFLDIPLLYKVFVGELLEEYVSYTFTACWLLLHTPTYQQPLQYNIKGSPERTWTIEVQYLHSGCVAYQYVGVGVEQGQSRSFDREEPDPIRQLTWSIPLLLSDKRCSPLSRVVCLQITCTFRRCQSSKGVKGGLCPRVNSIQQGSAKTTFGRQDENPKAKLF